MLTQHLEASGYYEAEKQGKIKKLGASSFQKAQGLQDQSQGRKENTTK